MPRTAAAKTRFPSVYPPARSPALLTVHCGKNIVDGMQSFLLPGSVYRHSANDSEGNLMSTEQAMLAHIALYKADNKLGRLYDFSKSKA